MTPKDHFGHNLFDDWDLDEWNRFYNLMFACVSMYLQGGIKKMETSHKLKRKHIKLSFGEEFLDWWEDYFANGCEEWKPFKELYNNFMIEAGFDKKEYSQKRFKRGLEVAAENYGTSTESRRNRSANNQHENRIKKNTSQDALRTQSVRN
jgi:hypothetical protein